jgi:hypothetical protein
MMVFPVVAVIALVSALILLDLAAARWGFDSRDGNDWADRPRV